ncbi:MAG: hypothetical protein ACTSYI_07760 [Promethearchaeota archaeon]
MNAESPHNVNKPSQPDSRSTSSPLSPEERQFYLNWGRNLVDKMNSSEMELFLTIAGSMLRCESIVLSHENIKILVRWGFENAVLAEFKNLDWKIFLPLLDQVSDNSLIQIAATVADA